MKLLLVDDDPDFRRLVVESAPSWLNVVPCGSTREATELLKAGAHCADVAMIDLHMTPHLGDVAEQEGWALLQWMNREQRSMPVIVATSHTCRTHKGSDFATMVSGVLRKPVDLGLLYEYLKAFGQLFNCLVDRDHPGTADGTAVLSV